MGEHSSTHAARDEKRVIPTNQLIKLACGPRQDGNADGNLPPISSISERHCAVFPPERTENLYTVKKLTKRRGGGAGGGGCKTGIRRYFFQRAQEEVRVHIQ